MRPSSGSGEIEGEEDILSRRMLRPLFVSLSTPPRRSAMLCRIGSGASWRVPVERRMDADAFYHIIASHEGSGDNLDLGSPI